VNKFAVDKQLNLSCHIFFPVGYLGLLSSVLIILPFIIGDAGLLPSFVRPSHIDSYAPGVELTRRLPASAMMLGKVKPVDDSS
jgi:hypothetical protein